MPGSSALCYFASIMKLFLLFSTPLAGAILLSLAVPGWSGRREFFSAGGRAFLWFWIAQLVSYMLSGSGLYSFSLGQTLLLRWSRYELIKSIFFIGGLMLWAVPRDTREDADTRISAVLIFAAVYAMFSGAAEALIHFNRFEPLVLFAFPFALIGGMLLSALSGLLFIGIHQWPRWLLFPLTALAGSLLSVVPHALFSGNLRFPAMIASLLLPAAAALGIYLTLGHLFPVKTVPDAVPDDGEYPVSTRFMEEQTMDEQTMEDQTAVDNPDPEGDGEETGDDGRDNG